MPLVRFLESIWRVNKEIFVGGAEPTYKRRWYVQKFRRASQGSMVRAPTLHLVNLFLLVLKPCFDKYIKSFRVRVKVAWLPVFPPKGGRHCGDKSAI